ncbi:MAG: endonuclease/exonuclease/phosphatase family protein [Acetobacteraceae bacterium]|nr:endonuclease/exonuclease/phosphatase family protein [Acetobacteraceae bacterium]
MKIISWNLLRLVGASPDEVADLVAREAPDVLLMQEATAQIDRLPQIIGGHYMRRLLPGRVHGLAVWSRQRPVAAPTVVVLPQGSMFRRIGLVVDLGDFSVANVHLSHGQVLNRRQLWRIASTLPPRAAVLGDFNLVGPCLLPGFRDVGPRAPTHRAADMVPLRIDRCLARGLDCLGTAVLGRASSDHHPIVVQLAATTPPLALAA